MRVAQISSYRPGNANGVHAAVAELAPRLANRGVDVEIWHFRRDATRVAERRIDGFAVCDIPFPFWFGPRSSRYVRRITADVDAWLADAAERIDAFHVHSVFQPEAWAVRRRVPRPYCISPQGGYSAYDQRTLRQRLKWPLWAAAEQELVNHATFFHAVSDADVSSVRTLRLDAPVVTIGNGIDVSDAASPDRPTRENRWVFVGRLDVRHKGIDLLLRGYARASVRVTLPPLIIHGPDFRRGRRQLTGLIRELGLGEDVVIGDAAYGAERDRLISESRLFVLTSRWEGLPVAALEALALGTPVLVTPQTNIADIVTAAEAGFVARSGDVADVADALEHAAGVPADELDRAGQRGRDVVIRNFQWDTAAEKLAAAYEEYFR